MSAVVRPMYLVGAGACAALQERAAAALHPWAGEWLRGGALTLQIQVASAMRDVAEAAEYERLQGAEGCLWVRHGRADRTALGTAVVGRELMPEGECADDWIATAVARAWQSRNRLLCDAVLGALASPESVVVPALPEELFAAGSGAVQFSCEALGLTVWAEAAAWRSLELPRKQSRSLPAPVPMERATRGARLQLQALLGGVDIDLAKLLDLRVGDVLRLPQRLDQHLVLVCAGQSIAQLVLGEAQGRRAVRLVAPSRAVPGSIHSQSSSEKS